MSEEPANTIRAQDQAWTARVTYEFDVFGYYGQAMVSVENARKELELRLGRPVTVKRRTVVPNLGEDAAHVHSDSLLGNAQEAGGLPDREDQGVLTVGSAS